MLTTFAETARNLTVPCTVELTDKAGRTVAEIDGEWHVWAHRMDHDLIEWDLTGFESDLGGMVWADKNNPLWLALSRTVDDRTFLPRIIDAWSK